MIIKLYFFVSLLVCGLFANSSFDIAKVQERSSSSEYLQCVEANPMKLDFEDIMDTTLLQNIEKSNKGYSFNNFWCKLELYNSSTARKDIVLFNPRPGMDTIESKVYKNNALYKSTTLGDMTALENRDFESIFSNFTLTLEPNEKVTIITKYHSMGNIDLDWEISTIKEFISYNNLNFTLIFCKTVFEMIVFCT